MHKCVMRGALALLPAGMLVLASDPRARAATDWPGWRGPNRDALSSETGLLSEWKAPGPPLAWKATGLGGGFSSLSVAGGRIYTMGDHFRYQNGLMLLVQATPDGYHERGSFTIPDVGLSWSHPVIADGKLLLREQDALYCYDVRAKG